MLGAYFGVFGCFFVALFSIVTQVYVRYFLVRKEGFEFLNAITASSLIGFVVFCLICCQVHIDEFNKNSQKKDIEAEAEK